VRKFPVTPLYPPWNRVKKQWVDQGSVRSDSPPLAVAATREMIHVKVFKPCVIHKV
jgi:hypothetical protein